MALILAHSRWLRFGSSGAFYFAQGVPLGMISIAIPTWRQAVSRLGLDRQRGDRRVVTRRIANAMPPGPAC